LIPDAKLCNSAACVVPPADGSHPRTQHFSSVADPNPRMPTSRTAPGSGSLRREHSAPINRGCLSLYIDNKQGRFLFQESQKLGAMHA